MSDRPYRDPEWLQSRIDDGLTSSEIAQEAGCSPSTIGHWRDLHGLTRPNRTGRPRTYTQLDDAEWLTDQLQTRTRSEIADDLGCSVRTVEQATWRHRLDWPTRQRHHDRGDQWVRIAEMIHEERSDTEIARSLGIHVQALRATIRNGFAAYVIGSRSR